MNNSFIAILLAVLMLFGSSDATATVAMRQVATANTQAANTQAADSQTAVAQIVDEQATNSQTADTHTEDFQGDDFRNVGQICSNENDEAESTAQNSPAGDGNAVYSVYDAGTAQPLGDYPVGLAEYDESEYSTEAVNTSGTDTAEISGRLPNGSTADAENDSIYVNDILLVVLDINDTAEERISQLETICETVGGEVVGQLCATQLFQIRVEKTDSAGLEALCAEARAAVGDDVSVSQDDILEPDSIFEREAYIPNDPWSGSQTWDESNPEGNNWWAEAVKLPSAWAYSEMCSNIKVGVLDSAVDTTNPDLTEAVCLSSKTKVGNHGTNVAGIISATGDNEVGIKGACPNSTLYYYDFYAMGSNVSNLLSGIEKMLSAGCRIMNCSTGYSTARTETQIAYDNNRYSTIIENYETTYGEDFIIVQSAGNNCIESRKNGIFCAVSDEAALEHIIVVGAVDKPTSGSYRMSYFSNYGDYVTLAAPGRFIYSAYYATKYQYDYDLKESVQVKDESQQFYTMSGTSQASPIVAGIAAFVWSINPELSPAEVKQILVDTADTTVSAYTSNDTRTYRLVNAEAAVDRAIFSTGLQYSARLTWTDTSLDLDSHLIGELSEGETLHVYYGFDNSEQAAPAYLYSDVVFENGIEEIEINDIAAFTEGVTYSVHDYTSRHESGESTSLAASGAKVELLCNEELIKTYTVPADGNGNIWNVFSITQYGSLVTQNELGFAE